MARTATTSTRDYNKYSLPTRPDARFLLILFARMVGRPLANSTAMISNSNGCCHGQCAYDWHQHIYRWTQREYWIENYTHIQIAERVEFNVLLTRYRKNCAQRIQIDQMCASFYDYYYCFFFFERFSPHVSFLASVAVARKRTIRWSSSTHSGTIHVFVSLAARFHDDE